MGQGGLADCHDGARSAVSCVWAQAPPPARPALLDSTQRKTVGTCIVWRFVACEFACCKARVKD